MVVVVVVVVTVSLELAVPIPGVAFMLPRSSSASLPVGRQCAADSGNPAATGTAAAGLRSFPTPNRCRCRARPAAGPTEGSVVGAETASGVGRWNQLSSWRRR